MAGISEEDGDIHFESECKQVVEILQAHFQSNRDNLKQSVQGCMKDFIGKLLDKGLVTQSTIEDRSENFDAVINEVVSSLNSMRSVTSLQMKFKDFHSVLMDLPGPPTVAGDVLFNDVQREVNQVLPDLHFLRNKCGRSTSEPSAAVQVGTNTKPEFHKNTYSVPDARYFKTEVSFIDEINTESSSATKGTDIDNSIFQDPKQVDDRMSDNGGTAGPASFTSPFLHPAKPPIISSSTPHQTMVLPNTGNKYFSTAGVVNPPTIADSHSTDSGMPISKMNSPIDGSAEKPLLGSGQPTDAMLDCSLLGVGTVTPQHESNYHSKPTERVLDSELSSMNDRPHYPPANSSQRLSSASESSIMSDIIYMHMREDMTHERKKREEAEKGKDNADKKRKKAEKKRQKLHEKLVQAESRIREHEEEIKKLRRDIEVSNIELKAERKEKESLEKQLSGLKVIADEIKMLNVQRMEFTQEKQKHKLEQDKLKAEMEKKQKELSEIEGQVSRSKSNFEREQAEQNDKLKTEWEIVNERKVHVEEEKRSLRQKKRQLMKDQDTISSQKQKFEKEMIERRKSFALEMEKAQSSLEQEMEQKRNELEDYEQEMEQKRNELEDYAKMMQATKDRNDKAKVEIEAERRKMKKRMKWYEYFLVCTGILLFLYTCILCIPIYRAYF